MTYRRLATTNVEGVAAVGIQMCRGASYPQVARMISDVRTESTCVHPGRLFGVVRKPVVSWWSQWWYANNGLRLVESVRASVTIRPGAPYQPYIVRRA